jgi:hypothetical protein
MNRKYKKAPKGPLILDDYYCVPSGPISITTDLDLLLKI